MRCVIDLTQDGERLIIDRLNRFGSPYELHQIMGEVRADLEVGAEDKLLDIVDGLTQYSIVLFSMQFSLKLRITSTVGNEMFAVVLDCNCSPSGPLSY